MKLKRSLFDLLAGVSLLLCVATVVLWVRSYSRFDQFTCFLFLPWDAPGPAKGLKATWESGHLILEKGSGSTTQLGKIGIFRSTWTLSRYSKLGSYTGSGSIWRFCGFAHETKASWYSVWVMPDQSVVLLTGTPAILWLSSAKRRRSRFAMGLCVECGYDLRATPDRCPECGAVVRQLSGAKQSVL